MSEVFKDMSQPLMAYGVQVQQPDDLGVYRLSKRYYLERARALRHKQTVTLPLVSFYAREPEASFVATELLEDIGVETIGGIRTDLPYLAGRLIVGSAEQQTLLVPKLYEPVGSRLQTAVLRMAPQLLLRALPGQGFPEPGLRGPARPM